MASGKQDDQRESAICETRNYLFRIREISESIGSQFLLLLIPVNPVLQNKQNSIVDNGHVFRGLDPLLPLGLTRADYTDPPDNHFNNSGHQTFAAFMLSLLTDLRLDGSAVVRNRWD